MSFDKDLMITLAFFHNRATTAAGLPQIGIFGLPSKTTNENLIATLMKIQIDVEIIMI